jgi:hypothetical protein
MAVGRDSRPPIGHALLGAGAATLAVAALRTLGFRRVTAPVRRLARTARRPAEGAEILTVLRAIDVGASRLPFRVACLERSLAAALWLGARRLGVTWQVGVRTPPFSLHAWLADASGTILGEPDSTLADQPLLTISPSDWRNGP